MKFQALVAAVASLFLCGEASAQDAQPAAAPPPAAAPAPVPGALTLPEGTVIELRTVDALSSATNKKGDFFRLALVSPIVVDGVVVVPAGAEGVGQVTVAAPSGFGGKAGEMMVLARYIEFGDVRVPLRGFTLGSRGRDNAALAIFIPYGVGIFVKGGNVVIPAGTDGQAKVAQTLSLSAAPAQTAVAIEAPAEPVAEAPAAPAS